MTLSYSSGTTPVMLTAVGSAPRNKMACSETTGTTARTNGSKEAKRCSHAFQFSSLRIWLDILKLLPMYRVGSPFFWSAGICQAAWGMRSSGRIVMCGMDSVMVVVIRDCIPSIMVLKPMIRVTLIMTMPIVSKV